MKLFIVVGLPSDERPLALVLLLFLALSDGLFCLYDRFWDMLNVYRSLAPDRFPVQKDLLKQ